MTLFLTSLGLVFAAELGDKTQLLAMAFAAKYKPWKVLTGIFAAVSLLNIIAVALGTYITAFIPLSAVRIAAAIMFLLFGVLNLRMGNEEEKERTFKLGAVLTVALTFFIGELGDKTQLMTIALAAQYNNPYPVFFGSTVGMLIADSLGVIVGSTVFKKIPTNIVKIISSGIFIFFGTIGLFNSIPSRFISPVTIALYFILVSASIFGIYRVEKKKQMKNF